MQHKPKLVAFYSHQPEVPEGAWPPIKKTQYINLALIKTEQSINFTKQFSRHTIRGSVDDIMKDKDNIGYNDAFEDTDDGDRLLFEGRPGCGKTTLMSKVSQDWARENILSSSLLFLVHLRRFDSRFDIKLEDILQSTLVEFTDKEIEHMCSCINENNGKGVAFALDGLDEYCPNKKKESLIYKLIRREYLPKSVVIIASRPAATQPFRRSATKRIEVLGFLRPQIDAYIDSYFPEKIEADGLKAYLEDHPNVLHMCYLPLHIAMVTYLYEIEGASLPQTETEIYYHFTLSTLLRSIQKRNSGESVRQFDLSSFEKLPDDDKIIFDLILELAYNATIVKPQQVFSADDMKELVSKQSSDTGNDESTLGLIVVDRYYVRYGLREIYTFLHLTFQEFLAACYIVHCSANEQKKLISKYSQSVNLDEVWKFYCGMIQFSKNKQNMDIFAELFASKNSNTLLQLRCAHESQEHFLCTHVVQSCNSVIHLNEVLLNPPDFMALGFVLVKSERPATKLAITSCHNIGREGLTALLNAIGHSYLHIESLRY